MSQLSVDGVLPLTKRPAGLARGQLGPAGRRNPAVETRPQAAPVRRLSQFDGLRRAQPLRPVNQSVIDMSRPAWPGVQAPAEDSGLDWSAPAETASLAPSLPAQGLIKMLALMVLGSALVLGAVRLNRVWPTLSDRLPSLHVAIPQLSSATATTQAKVQPVKPAAPSAEAAGLQKTVNSFIASQSVPYGVMVKDLKNDDVVAGSASSAVFRSASLYKLFVARGIFKRIDDGSLSYGSPTPAGYNVGDCLSRMITWSDNLCGSAMGSMLGWGDQDGNLHSAGFKNTSLAQPQSTSAGDVALLLERLYRGTLLSPSSTDHFMGLLKAQQVNNRLPVGLPPGTVIAHKTGDLDGFVHDAGIVFGPKTDYVIVVESGPWNYPGNAPGNFADFSNRIYGYLEK